MKKKIALITGITGQDGAYLLEFLLKKNYIIHGVKRRTSLINTQRIDHIFEQQKNLRRPNFFLHHGDLNDALSIQAIIKKTNPDEIYNLAAQSHVAVSFEQPEYTANSDALGILRILESVKTLNLKKKIKIYQASTSELFGKVQNSIQNEKTPFYPRSPYGVAKLYAFWIVKNYREAYNMFACNGILFNHESPLRGETFVTRKITRAVAKIVLGKQNKIYMGNLSAERDWGHAKDYVEGMYLILQQDRPQDYVLATGITTTVRNFLLRAFIEVGIEIEFEGENEKEIGKVKKCNGAYNLPIGKAIVEVDSTYYRPTEVDLLIGDPRKAKNNWDGLLNMI